MRDLVAGVGLSLLAIAGLAATVAWESRVPPPARDPYCELSHQAIRVDFYVDMIRGRPSFTYSIETVCDRYRPLPPPDLAP